MNPLRYVSVPVVFWGHLCPGDPGESSPCKFNISYSIDSDWWMFASNGESIVNYCQKWIDDTFKPTYKCDEQNVRVSLRWELVRRDGEPLYLDVGLMKCYEIPMDFIKAVNNLPPFAEEPSTSQFYKQIDIDKENWQSEDALIKKRGDFS